MAAFTISEAAGRAIQGQFEFSPLERPIASLLDSSQAFPTSAEMVDAISRAVSEEEMLELAMKEHKECEPLLQMRLDVGIYREEDVPHEYRMEIAGFPFTMASAMFERLTDHVLDHDGRAFILRRGERIFASLDE